MFKRYLSILFFLFSCISYAANAESPLSAQTEPLKIKFQVVTHGLNVNLNWESLSDAKGYKLYFAPSSYTGAESINSIDVGNSNSLSFDLWQGAAFYIALSAYDAEREIGFSTIELLTFHQQPKKGISIFAVDGLSFENLIMPGEQTEHRPSYLRTKPLNFAARSPEIFFLQLLHKHA